MTVEEPDADSFVNDSSNDYYEILNVSRQVKQQDINNVCVKNYLKGYRGGNQECLSQIMLNISSRQAGSQGIASLVAANFPNHSHRLYGSFESKTTRDLRQVWG